VIILQEIRFQNFLSTGNLFTKIKLNDTKTTLICGSNGSGKSTVMDAICFVLFNKPFRKINKPQLVNSITNKNMLTEIDFSVNGVPYMVRRGIKPAVFEIYCNGKFLNQSADNRDFQEILESNILKMNYKTFCQIVILGSANFTPFMQLPAAARRNIIEDLLDIQVFSVMNNLLKDKVANNKTELQELEHSISLCKKAIELNERHQKELKNKSDNIIKDKKKQIEKCEQENVKLSSQKSKLEKQYTEIQEKLNKLESLKEKYSEGKYINSKLINQISELDKNISFYNDSENCPTCHQGINSNFKTNAISSLDKKKKDKQSKIEILKESLSKIESRLDIYSKISNDFSEIGNKLNGVMNDINFNNRTVISLQNEITKLSDSESSISSISIQEEKKQLRIYQKQKERLIEERELYGIGLMMLKDGGIKTQIIKQYVPIMNQLINRYLEEMEFFCQFEINESFEETIKSRFRDSFSYASFSEGEKMRIDLALLFTWREMARMRNASPINLLILDEIMDSSLDSNGTEEFINILSKLTGDNNVVIISHKHEQIVDKFDKVLKIEKHKNFSRIEQ